MIFDSLIYAEYIQKFTMDSRGRIGPLELLMYGIVATYIAASIHVFGGLLRFQYGVELIVIIVGMATFLWLAGLAAVLPAIARHVALVEAARGVSKAGSGVREWGRAQRERVRRENEVEAERDRWRRYR